MTFNKRQESQASIRSVDNQTFISSSDEFDHTHHVCDTNRGVMIKNSFDQWKGKIAEPFDQVKSAEVITDFNTNLTTKAAQVPLIIEEENKQE
jgi:hypothetical protein